MAYANLPQWAFLHRWRALPETSVHFLMFIDTFKSFSLTFHCLHFDNQSEQVFFLFLVAVFSKSNVILNLSDYSRLMYWFTRLCTKLIFNLTLYLRNRKYVPCFYRVIETLVKVWENLKKLWKHSPAARVPTAFLVLLNFHLCFYNSIETRHIFSIS